MSQPQAQINHTPVATMNPQGIRDEAKQLRVRIAEIQSELSKRRAWAAADGKDKDKQYLTWLANTRSLHGKLQVRYTEIRAAEKELNARQHTRKPIKGNC